MASPRLGLVLELKPNFELSCMSVSVAGDKDPPVSALVSKCGWDEENSKEEASA